MSNGKFMINSAAVQRLLKSQELKSVVEKSVTKIAVACNAGKDKGYRINVDTKYGRASGAVITSSEYAKRDNAKHNTLLKCVDRGRI
jgi:hypothetical protein